MKLIKSLLGRRQFLIAAGAASASVLAFKKLGKIFAPSFQKNGATVSDSFTSIALAGEKATAGVKARTDKYPHLLSPLRVRNKVLKNRILHTPSPPHSLQGPENFPSDSVRSHYSQIAKNAAIVTMVEHFGEYPKTWQKN